MAIGEPEAVVIAKAEAKRRGWTWREPISITRKRRWLWFGPLVWQIYTNTAGKGVNIRMTIDAADGHVRAAGYLPR